MTFFIDKISKSKNGVSANKTCITDTGDGLIF